MMEISGIKLHRVGGENDPAARAVVEVQINGNWLKVLSEPLGANFCSAINDSGIVALMAKELEEEARVDIEEQKIAKL